MACVTCKEKKLKCDNNAAGCENCRRSSSVCLVEDPATGRHRPRNYVETLEQRVAFLEGILKGYRPDLANDHLFRWDPHGLDTQTGSSARVPVDDQLNSPPGPSTLSKADDETEEHDDGLDELASKAGLLSLNAAGAEPHYLGSSSTFAFSRLINASLRQVVLNRYNYPSTSGQTEDESSMLLAPCLLPDYDIALKLSDAYFQNIHPQYPFLHEPTFRTWEATLASGLDAFEEPLSDSVALFFLYMVYAVGALILPNSGYSAEQLYISAQMYIDPILTRDNLESIQAIMCCAIYSLRSSLGTSHWKLAGLALRQCIDLGYHRSSKRLRSTANPLVLEMQRRVFWCAYTMESQAAVMLGRPQGIPYQEVDAEVF
ncbi:Fc.00g079410.m01.CDS01 [Cosmosporella sp. VM-42]